jgi:hypothetical protein
MRGRNERHETTTPRRVWGGDIDANHGPLLDGDRGKAGELGDQIPKVRLVPDEEQGVVTAPGEELCNVRCSRPVGEVLVDSGGCL